MSTRQTTIEGGRRYGRTHAIRQKIAELREDAAYWKDQSSACRHDMMESGKYLNQSRRCKEQADALELSITTKPKL